MGELTEHQLLLLDNLIYLEEVANKNDKKIAYVISNLLYKDGLEKSRTKNHKKIGTNDEWPCYMTKLEWLTVLKQIEADPVLMSLTVKHGVTEVITVTDKKGKIHEVGGMRAACFVDESDTSSGNNATVIFRGTCGDFEWDDNSKGGTQPDTIQQKKALEYIEGLKEYDNITVSGHSKGGNKSQYVAIESDKVDRCVSFDGQGFSKEFLERDE